MSIHILQNVTFLAPNGVTPFTAVGGTGPYVYSVVSGGAGGTINASTGLYTAPIRTGVDTIKAVDAVSAVATTTVTIGTPLQLVCDIIKTQLALSADQIWMYDQKVKIPNDSRLYVVVGISSCKPFANSIRNDGSGSGLNGVQSANFSATLSIDIFSRSTDALNRKEEVLMALMSNYSESQQEANSFRIFPLTVHFVNLSELEGSAIPYRFNLSVNMQYFASLMQAIPYYDSFSDPEIFVDP